MPFPTLSPSRRVYTPGDWAQEKFRAMNGSETRIRYGDKRTDAKLSLQYKNISDEAAEEFIADYNAKFGTFKSFTLPVEVLDGWSETNFLPSAGADAIHFRYDKPPSLRSVRPGVSNVSVELVSVI